MAAFVHAGCRPGVTLNERSLILVVLPDQSEESLPLFSKRVTMTTVLLIKERWKCSFIYWDSFNVLVAQRQAG